MKRVLTFLAILLLPLSVWAMTPVSDSDLSNVTGQAGVNINANLKMTIDIGTMAWGDSDGIGALAAVPGWGTQPGYGTGATTGGYVGITSFNITDMTIQARINDTYNLGAFYGNANYALDYLKPITIDVATGTKGGVANTTFVRIGLGSLEVQIPNLDFHVYLTDRAGIDDLGAGQKLGDAYVGGLGIFINPASYVDIYNSRGDGSCGVTMDMYVRLDHINLNVLSWGDSDGLAGGNVSVGGLGTVPWMHPLYNSAGWVGLGTITMGPVTIDGAVNIDVATTAAGIYAAHGTVTVVHISFGDVVHAPAVPFTVNIDGPITGIVKLAAAKGLGLTPGTLGDIYLSGFGLDIAAGSWVDIWAH